MLRTEQWLESSKIRHMGELCDQRALCAWQWAGYFAAVEIHSMAQPGFPPISGLTAGVGKST